METFRTKPIKNILLLNFAVNCIEGAVLNDDNSLTLPVKNKAWCDMYKIKY